MRFQPFRFTSSMHNFCNIFFPQGWDEAYCLRYLNDFHEIHFFGDKTYKVSPFSLIIFCSIILMNILAVFQIWVTVQSCHFWIIICFFKFLMWYYCWLWLETITAMGQLHWFRRQGEKHKTDIEIHTPHTT